ncbi:MAG: DUF1501 domain-containing protein [Planctomycetaceae bacterium]|nr:DUF1501 domain-containing protein [Planctomycetaceae bacterium]
MLTVTQNRPNGQRRALIQAAGAGLLGLNLPDILAAQQIGAAPTPRIRNVIFLFLFGGPSQLETFDMKPTAPTTIRGPWKPTPCKTPGLHICEKLPLTASITDRLTVIKTMSHDFNDHSGGSHYVQTGHRWQVPIGGGFNVTPQDWPAMGSVVKHFQRRQGSTSNKPSYVVLPNSLGRLQEYKVRLKRPGETAGFLPPLDEPLITRIDKKDTADNPYWRNMADEELSFEIDGLQLLPDLQMERLINRNTLLEQFNRQRDRLQSHAGVGAMNDFRRKALDLVSSEDTRIAFDVTKEPDKLRNQYGNHLFGQSVLVARRLIEAGTRFVTVHYDCVDGYSWDSHRNCESLDKHLLPTLDSALSSLVLDLETRGLLDETLVVCMGEMGRTPKAKDGWGRDHWSTLFPAVLAGGGIKKGFVYGRTDRDAAYATENMVTPEDLSRTILEALGVNPAWMLPGIAGRPQLVSDGKFISDIWT